ncbi:tRNA pseudouridine synthase 1 [Pyricularia oryzae]
MAADDTPQNGTAKAAAAPTGNEQSSSGHRGNRGGRGGGQRNQRGGRGGRGGRRGGWEDNKGKDGWNRKRHRDRDDRPNFPSKRSKNNEDPSSFMNIQFSAEEIAAEERKPKKKVAVLIGYAGTGYKGMQINHFEKTIEGDLFRAFVDAGAISKANASDPKKVSLMRCARTDKGVHAASNVISLKLIVPLEEKELAGNGNAEKPDATADGTTAGEVEAASEVEPKAVTEDATEKVESNEPAAEKPSTEPLESNAATVAAEEPAVESKPDQKASEEPAETMADLVARINSHLPDQIRVWDILRTNNSFSCYQACDSRWYEYLMPTHALIPPHPDSYLGKKVISAVNEKGEYDDWKLKFADLNNFWENVEEKEIKPLLESLDPEVRKEVKSRMHMVEEGDYKKPSTLGTEEVSKPSAEETEAEPSTEAASEKTEVTPVPPADDVVMADAEAPAPAAAESSEKPKEEEHVYTPAELAIRDIKATYVAAKRRYRVSQERIGKLQAALDKYVGTHNFHNYTILKKFTDSSAKRHIKSFKVNPEPIQIGETEWVSLKVHGQSFMMHQIRKMVAMAVLTVRCGVPLDRITQSYEAKRISIPKAPGLGLLLERPVFENYSYRAVQTLGKEPLNFDKYEDEIEAFKRAHIYQRMWDVEEQENIFHTFFNQIDNFHTDHFLWVTAHGFDAAYERKERERIQLPRGLEAGLGDDDDENPEDGDG